jgi:hypothetical protein
MTTLSQQFVSPTELDSSSSIAALLMLRYQRTLAQLYTATGSNPVFDGAWQFVAQGLEQLVATPRLVNPGLGRLTQAGLNPEHGVLQAVLLLASQGGKGQCRLPLALKHTAYFDCHLIDLHSAADIDASNDLVSIRTHRNGERVIYDFVRVGETWKNREAPEGSVYVGKSLAINLICGENSFILDERVTAIFPFSSSPLNEIARDLDAALSLLEVHAPEYLGWIGNILRAIVFLGPTDGSTVSHSSELRPGVVAISHPIDIPHFAAQLVHECSHQYFFLYQHEHVLTNFKSKKAYPSPLREEPRPLVLSLLAVHASVNILKMIKKALESGARSGFFASEVDELEQGIERAIAGMESSDDFTDAGREFFVDTCLVQREGELA